MGKPENLTEKMAKAQSIDFVEQFGKEIKTLLTALSVNRRIEMPIGSTLKRYTSKVTLNPAEVEKGDIIPLSKVETTPAEPVELKWKKHRKAVAIEDIQTYGFNQAIVLTDEKLKRELQKGVKADMFTHLSTGTTTATGVGLKGALAVGWGQVHKLFEDDEVATIGFVNPLDVADYLATANLTLQTAFGLNYVENFLGLKVAVVTASVPAKTVYVTAADNLVFAYAKVDGGEVGKVFDFTTDETGIIGITHDIDKSRLTAETTTVSGATIFAERLDGIVKVTVQKAPGA